MTSPELPATIAARRIRAVREQRGLTIKQLAARCAEIGAADLTVVVLQRMETHGRNISVNDIFAVAYALNVSPFVLFMPTQDVEMKITWDVTAWAHDVSSWWMGHQPRPEVEPANDDARLAALVEFRQHMPYAGQHSRIQIEAGNIRDLVDEITTPEDGQQS